ncbi:hypothetical protein RJ640_010463 [Escallonia rubra]|uniref:S-protein homolog n=1 Tax=Escallonia rubra TaxID=112253 RepID=A0AA88R9B9_9ASTE|nr:hypothetical protein RJ640_010463 [Escallonia rubra]
MGYHTLYVGGDFHFRFRNNVHQTTLLFCHFYWNSKDKKFDAFNMNEYATKSRFWTSKLLLPRKDQNLTQSRTIAVDK